MIFVTVGTNEAPFERLLRLVDDASIDEELIVQTGPASIRPRGARCISFLRFDELVAHVNDARVVITHAGVGSVIVSLRAGKRPIVVPRLRQFGEAVDDHQLHFARRAAEMDYVTLVGDSQELAHALDHARAGQAAAHLAGTELARDLRGYLEQVTS